MGKSASNMTIFLSDNGSLRPAATHLLREMAGRLSGSVKVHPVSVMHSSRIPSAELGGTPAEVLREALAHRIGEGETNFGILPFFLGPSNAMEEYVPMVLEELGVRESVTVRIAPPMGASREDHRKLAEELVRGLGPLAPDEEVILVDHGTPRADVNQVRREVADCLAPLLPGGIVLQAAMESREGPEYAFNHPLLADLLRERRSASSCARFAIAFFFLSPGRHAGAGGDVDQICREALGGEEMGHAYRMTPVLGPTPTVEQILRQRLDSLMAGESWLEFGPGGRGGISESRWGRE